MGKVQFGTTVEPSTVEVIERLAKLEGIGKGELIDLAVAAYDKTPTEDEAEEIADDASLVVPIPRDRDMLKDVILSIIAKAPLHENYVLAGVQGAAHEYKKGLPEYKTAERMRQEFAERRELNTRPLTYDRKGPSLK